MTADRPRYPLGGRSAGNTSPMNAEAGVQSTPQGEHSGFGLFESPCPHGRRMGVDQGDQPHESANNREDPL